MIKLLVTDLDGTLLSPTGVISEGNIEALRKLEEKGVKVLVATGRSYESARISLDDAGIVCPVICLNGANVYDENGKMIKDTSISRDFIHRLYETIDPERVYFELYTNKGIFSTEREKFLHVLVSMLKERYPEYTTEKIRLHAEQRFQDESFHFISDFEALLSDNKLTPYKVLTFSLDDEALKEIRHSFSDRKDITITSSGLDNLEFNDPKATKGIALKAYCETLAISLDEVLAIGDNENDLSMLEIAGIGVAMENGHPLVKERIKNHTKSHKEDGVKVAIDRYILKS